MVGPQDLHIVIYLVGDWDTFHRRPMLEALARNARGTAEIICINPPAAPPLQPFRRPDLVRRWLQGGRIREVSPNLYLYTPTFFIPPRLVPGRVGERFYFSKIQRQVSAALRRMGLGEGTRVVWVFRPEQVSWLPLLRRDLVVYECYDEYTLDAHDGHYDPGVACLEQELLAHADVVLATAPSLYEHREAQHSNAYYTPMGGDFSLFSQALDPGVPVAPEIAAIPGPRIGYLGMLSTSYIDEEWLRHLASARPSWSLVLLGPVDPGMERELAGLRSLPNVFYLGTKRREDLPSYAKGFDVAVIPYRLNEFGHRRIPNKMWEYMAAGVPIVSCSIREISSFSDTIFFADTKEQFVDRIEAALSNGRSERTRLATETARRYSWDGLTRKTLEIVLDHVGRLAPAAPFQPERSVLRAGTSPGVARASSTDWLRKTTDSGRDGPVARACSTDWSRKSPDCGRDGPVARLAPPSLRSGFAKDSSHYRPAGGTRHVA